MLYKYLDTLIALLPKGLCYISAWLYTVAPVLINHIISFSSALTRSAKVLADQASYPVR